MLEPNKVRDMIRLMAEINTNKSLTSTDFIPLMPTVKCRIGVDQNDTYEELHRFVDLLSNEGLVKHFIIHARKAILDKKFSPKDNRTIPPLSYDTVYRLVQDFPHLDFTLNGGVKTYDQVLEHYTHGVKGAF
jgi:tRNA-dihydrouridine synthase A